MSAAAAKLEVGFIGEDARHDPHISAFGLMSRLTVLNDLRPGNYFEAFGLRVRRDEDLSHALTFSLARQRALAAGLGIVPPTAWTLEGWMPFHLRGAVPGDTWQFRYCSACLRTGYHTLLFQLPWIHRCPWHGRRLRTTCTRCERPMRVSGAGDQPLLGCECEHCNLDVVDALVPDPLIQTQRQAFLDAYLAWATQERATTVVMAPASGTADWNRLCGAVRLPMGLSERCQDPAEPTYLASPIDTQRAITKWPAWGAPAVLDALDSLTRDDPGVLDLHPIMAAPFRQIAQNIAVNLPPASLTDLEMSLFFPGLSGDQARGFSPARRRSAHDLRFLPPHKIGDRSFLHLHTVPPAIVRSAWCVVQDAVAGGMAGRLPHERDRAAAAAVIAIRLLARGYVMGMRAVLARHIPAMFDDARLRPRYAEPWVWVRKTNGFNRYAVMWSPERMPDGV